MATEERLSTEDLVAPKATEEHPDTDATADDHTSYEQQGSDAEQPDERASVAQEPDTSDGQQSDERGGYEQQTDQRGSYGQRPDERVELFGEEEIERFRGRWQSLQTAFVDDPRETVQGADQLVAEVMQALASTFADHKRELETQWQQGEEVATEDLRLALQRYRTFFNELLRN